MNKLKAFIENYKSILVLKKSCKKTYNIIRYILIFTITFLTMGLIFTVLFPNETVTENLGYIVMSIITVFLGSFLVATFDAEEVFQKKYRLSYSIKTVLFFKGLEKATIIIIIIRLLLSAYFDLLTPTYLMVMLLLAAIILGGIVITVNYYLKSNYLMLKRIIIDTFSIYLYFLIIPKVIYIEEIHIAFLTYTALLLAALFVRVVLIEYTKFTYVKLNTVKIIFTLILLVIFLTIYNNYNHNVMGKPIIKREFSLDMSDPGGYAYKSLVHEDKIYVLNRRLFVYDFNTGGSEIMYDQVIPGMATNMVIYDNLVHFRYKLDGEETLRYGYINENRELVEEVSTGSCQVEDYMQFGYFHTIPKCLESEEVYLTKDIYYSIKQYKERALFSTIDSRDMYYHPITDLAYDNFVLARLNKGQSFFNSTLKIIDVTESSETDRQHLSIPKDIEVIKLMDIKDDVMTFTYGDSIFNSRSTDYIMTYDAEGKLFEYIEVFHPYIFYDADDEHIYLITIGDYETANYIIYVLDKEHFSTFVMPKYSIRSDSPSLIPVFDREQKLNPTLEILFSVMIFTMIIIPPLTIDDEKKL